MTAALSPADRAKLAKLMALTTSDQPGERDNAVTFANRIIKRAGLSWTDLILAPEPERLPSPVGRRDWRVVVHECLGRTWMATEWERGFLRNISSQSRISAPQRTTLNQIARKLGVGGAW
jgi:hypothetical protein